MPDTPTQEVETWPAHVCDVHGLLQRSQTRLGFGEPVGGRLECNFCPIEEPPRFVAELQVMPVEDHQRRLLAVEEERDTWKLYGQSEAIRSGELQAQLEEVAQELEERNADWEEAARLAIQRKRVIEEVEDELEERAEGDDNVNIRIGLQEALQLLREQLQGNSKSVQNLEKGTEQGGDADDHAASDRARGSTSGAPQGRHVAEAGVPVEGDPGLLDQALAALDEIASRPTTQRNPDGDDQAAEAMALLAREHAGRIRGLQGKRGEG